MQEFEEYFVLFKLRNKDKETLVPDRRTFYS